MTEAKPKRRWLQFSLRALLVFTTVLCVWIGIKVNAARRQHDAVAAIVNAGGTVGFDYQWFRIPGGGPDDISKDWDAMPPGPEWLRKFIGDEYFREVIDVTFGKHITDSGLTQLPKLFAVKYVDFGSREKGIPKGQGFQWPKGADVSVLEQLSQLQGVSFYHVEIDDSILSTLVKLNHLKFLVLESVPIGDPEMVEIGKMTNLEVLNLSGTRITDDGLKHIQNLKKLNAINLEGTDVSAAGLKYLEGLPALTSVYPGSRVTPKEWQDFQKSLQKH